MDLRELQGYRGDNKGSMDEQQYSSNLGINTDSEEDSTKNYVRLEARNSLQRGIKMLQILSSWTKLSKKQITRTF